MCCPQENFSSVTIRSGRETVGVQAGERRTAANMQQQEVCMSTNTREVTVQGAIDCDGHILEPPTLWEEYLDPRYRDRAIRIRTDHEGWEYFEFAGKPSRLCFRGFPGILGAMGRPDIVPGPDRTYLQGAPPGSMNAKERLERLNREGLSKAILYPTIGLLWEAEVQDPDLSAAYCRAYNRWIIDFCSDSGGRLIPIAHLSASNAEEAAKELERAVKAGAKGGFIAPFSWTKKAPGHPYLRCLVGEGAGTRCAIGDPSHVRAHRSCGAPSL